MYQQLCSACIDKLEKELKKSLDQFPFSIQKHASYHLTSVIHIAFNLKHRHL